MDGTPGRRGGGRNRRRSRLGRAMAAALSFAAATSARSAAAAGEHVSFLRTPAGPVLLVLPAEAEAEAAARRPSPIVLALPDAPGPDGRGRPYLDALNAASVATAEFVPLGDDGDGEAPPADALPAVLAALAAEPRVDASRFGVLAFGAGARAALRGPAPAGAPTVLLYPGCAGLPPPPGDRALLLLHGGAGRANPPGACRDWAAAAPSVRRHEYFHATHAWDFSDGPWSDGLALLPGPGDPGRRVWARADPATTGDAAARAAAFLAAALDSAGAGR